MFRNLSILSKINWDRVYFWGKNYAPFNSIQDQRTPPPVRNAKRWTPFNSIQDQRTISSATPQLWPANFQFYPRSTSMTWSSITKLPNCFQFYPRSTRYASMNTSNWSGLLSILSKINGRVGWLRDSQLWHTFNSIQDQHV